MTKEEKDLIYGWLSSINNISEDDGAMTRGEKLELINHFTDDCMAYIDILFNNPFIAKE